MKNTLQLLDDRSKIVHAIEHFEIMTSLKAYWHKPAYTLFADYVGNVRVLKLELKEDWQISLFSEFLQKLKDQAEIDKKALQFELHRNDITL